MHDNKYFAGVVTCLFRVVNQICSVRVRSEKNLEVMRIAIKDTMKERQSLT
jgi:hypothetical protein